MIPSHQTGTLCELKAAAYYVERGYDVFFPITINPKCDFVASKAKKILKVQVKKASWSKSGKFKYLQVRLIGKKEGDFQKIYKLEDFDVLIVIDGPNLWEIPVEDVIGRTSLCLASNNPNPRKNTGKSYDPSKWLKEKLSESDSVGC